MRFSTTASTAPGTLSSKQSPLPDREIAVDDDRGLVDELGITAREINAKCWKLAGVDSSFGEERMGMDQEMGKVLIFLEDGIGDELHDHREPGVDKENDDDLMTPEERPTSTESAQTIGQTKNAKFGKGGKDESRGRCHSRRSRRRCRMNNSVSSNQEPTSSNRFWKRVGKSLGKHLGRVVRFIGMGALVAPPLPVSSYVPVHTRNDNSWSANENVSPSYGMLLF
nr:uncharacterized protein LOC129264132 [Lytechinus pictus]